MKYLVNRVCFNFKPATKKTSLHFLRNRRPAGKGECKVQSGLLQLDVSYP